MSLIRFCVYLTIIVLASAPAFSKNETLAERGKRMCEEEGVTLEDCTILPPELRGPGPNADVAAVTPAPRPLGDIGAGPTTFGTGKYGWCDDCTSLIAAAPVTPWSDFGGRQFQSQRDEDDRQFAAVDDNSAPGGAPDNGDDGDDGDNGDGGDDGDNGDDGGDDGDGDTGGGEICD